MDILSKALDYQIEPVKHIMEQSKTAKPYGTVFFGDSLIQSFPLAHYFDQVNLYNCGCNGATTDFLLHLQPYAVKDYNPRKVIILIGTNDLSDTWQFDKLEIAFNVFKLINIMRNHSPAIDIVVISPLPIIESLKRTKLRDNTQLRLLGNEIEANVKEFSGTTYVDVFDAFLDDNQQLKEQYTIDGLHLSEEGYSLLAQLIKDYI